MILYFCHLIFVSLVCPHYFKGFTLQSVHRLSYPINYYTAFLLLPLLPKLIPQLIDCLYFFSSIHRHFQSSPFYLSFSQLRLEATIHPPSMSPHLPQCRLPGFTATSLVLVGLFFTRHLNLSSLSPHIYKRCLFGLRVFWVHYVFNKI